MTTTTTEMCSVRWCEERAEHDGPHRKRLLDTFVMETGTGRPVIFQAWISGQSARVRSLVLVVAGVEVGLTWVQVDQLEIAVSSAQHRFASGP